MTFVCECHCSIKASRLRRFSGIYKLQLVVPSGSLEVQYKPLLCVWLQLIYTSIINLFMVLIVPFDCTLLEVHILVMWWTMAYSCRFIWLKFLNKGNQIKTWRDSVQNSMQNIPWSFFFTSILILILFFDKWIITWWGPVLQSL